MGGSLTSLRYGYAKRGTLRTVTNPFPIGEHTGKKTVVCEVGGGCYHLGQVGQEDVGDE